MRRRISFCLAGAVLLACAAVTPVSGQVNTGAVAGLIQDPSGRGVPDARIQATNELTGVTRTTISNSTGRYSLSFLPIGRYAIIATATGFSREVRRGVSLSAGQVVTIDVSLHLKTSSTTGYTREMMQAVVAHARDQGFKPDTTICAD